MYHIVLKQKQLAKKKYIEKKHIIARVYFDDNSGKNLFLPAKTIFGSPVFTMEKPFFSTKWQKPANPAF